MVNGEPPYKQDARFWGWLAGAVGALVIVFMLLTPFIFRKVALDAYGCPQAGSRYKTVILLDNSDRLSSKQRANLDIFLGCIMGNVADGTVLANDVCANEHAVDKYERLVAYQLPDHGARPELLESACSPGNITTRKVSEKLSEGRRFAYAKWERFKLDIYSSFEHSRLSAGADQTPLLEGIQYIASREFSPPNVARHLAKNAKPEGRLIVISDFIQNSSALNQFKQLGSLEGILRDYPFSLSATQIEMRYLKRPAYKSYQTPAHQSWWAEFLNYKGYGIPKAEVW